MRYIASIPSLDQRRDSRTNAPACDPTSIYLKDTPWKSTFNTSRPQTYATSTDLSLSHEHVSLPAVSTRQPPADLTTLPMSDLAVRVRVMKVYAAI